MNAQALPFRVAAFDAVGTLIHPAPAVAEVYGTIVERHGLRLEEAELHRRFRAALHRQDEYDRCAGWRTSEAREHERWRQIVAEVLAELANADCAFEELWQHFAQPQSWRFFSDVAGCLTSFQARGVETVIASNFDGRLRQVLAGLPELAGIRTHVISSEVGWRKPAAEFFQALCDHVRCGPEQICLIGDDLENDCHGGQRAGLRTVLLDRTGRRPGVPSVASLSDPQLIEMCR